MTYVEGTAINILLVKLNRTIGRLGHIRRIGQIGHIRRIGRIGHVRLVGRK